MTCLLLISVRFHDGRYHGLREDNRTSEWPPSPGRLFQALVACAAKGQSIGSHEQNALKWLEKLAPPIVCAPVEMPGQRFEHFMPNNDLDAKGNDIERIGEVRAANKRYRPRLFNPDVPFLYAWTFEKNDLSLRHAQSIVELAGRLYQLGRGVDMAWAVGEILDTRELDPRLAEYRGVIYRPCEGGAGVELLCPQPGSLASLIKRYQQFSQRFEYRKEGGRLTVIYKKPDPPRFQNIRYDSPCTYLLFDLRNTAKTGAPFVIWPIERCAELVITLRGEVDENGTPTSGAAKKLWDALPDRHGEIARVLIGREATEADKSRRVRILPLPSIGHAQVDRGIRRVLIEIPANCPLHRDDVAWAFSGLEVSPADFDSNTGEIFYSPQLVPAQERDMLRHYGIETGEPARTWRSVTPLALPESARRRRIDPERQREEAKNGSERRTEHERAAAAVLQALRHASIRTPVWSIRAQREPFEAKGAHAEAFAAGTRFDKRRLWHVELNFVEPVCGPLVLGDGRYCGLGLMAPSEDANTGLYAFRIRDGLAGKAEPRELAQALRRAVMARVQAQLGDRQTLPFFFSGHAADGSALRNGNHQHLAFVADLTNHRLLIVAPHRFEHRPPTSDERRRLLELEQALGGLHELRARATGLLRLAPEPICAETDPLLARSCHWVSYTPYLATRRAKRDVAAFMEQDIRAELVRRGLPMPNTIELRKVAHGDKGLACADVVVTFKIAVSGPILLGRDFHSGGGLFGGQTSTASLNPTASGV